MGIGSPEQETKSSEVLKPVNSDPKLGAYSENMAEATTNGHLAMAEATTNGHLANHVNNIDSAFNISAQANEHIREHKKEHKSPSSENKHRDSNHSSSSKHHSSSPGSSKHHSSSSSKHHSSSSSKHSSPSSSKHHSSSSSKHHSSSSSKHHSSSSSKHHSSSSSSKDPSKHSSSSSKDPSRHSSSKDSSKHSSPSKHHSSSSKDPSKHHSSSSSKHHSSSSKHKDGSSKHKDGSSSSSSHKHHGSDKPIVTSPSQVGKESLSPEPLKVKPDPMSPTKIKAESISPMKIKIKHEVAEDSDDDMPLSARLDKVKSEPKPDVVKRTLEDSEDDEPLSAKLARVSKKMKEESQDKKSKKRKHDAEDFEPAKKKKKNREPPKVHIIKSEKEMKKEAREAKKLQIKKKEEETKWKWWEEDENAGHSDGTLKWKSLQHMGPVLAPAYEPLPDHVRFFHKGKQMRLSEETEEVATFYGRMLDHDYTTKEVFNRNFLKDWRKVMTSEEREKLTDLSQCDFREILTYFKEQSEKRKAMTKEEKNVIKEQNAATVEEYGFCIIDGHKQKIGNFRVEPPGLFRGRGDHPKQGMLKKRIHPREIIINCSKGATVPQPPYGGKWKEVRHDNTVTWLACWCENIQGSTKYVMLNAASKLKGEKDWKKYEMARELHKHADRIRAVYREDWRSKEMRIRQRSVAMYFIDKLALRAGNEKDEDQADTVGCCSLRVEHLNLHEKFGNEECVVEFDFLGKDSIRYYNKVSVEKRVFKNLQLFKDNKNEGDDLFDRLNTSILNKYLQGLMDGLTAKVFRTYNASKTLQEQLDLLTAPDDPLTAKVLSYNRANRAVAVLCNHQRAVSKNFDKQMENIQSKIQAKKDAVHDAKKDVKKSKSDYKALKTEASRKMIDRKKKTVERLEEQLTKLEVMMTDKDENKDIALGTSKLNYLDPRISVAWCKKWEVPIEKVYNKTQREKFAWAIDMAEDDYRF